MTQTEKRLLKATILNLENLYNKTRQEERLLNKLLESGGIETDTNNFTIIHGYLQEGYSKPLLQYIEEELGEKL